MAAVYRYRSIPVLTGAATGAPADVHACLHIRESRPAPCICRVASRSFGRPVAALDGSSLQTSARSYKVRTDVYFNARATLVESSGGVGKEMKAAAPGTDAHATSMARVGTDRDAQPPTAHRQTPRRLVRPPRSASSVSPLAAVRLAPVPARIELQRARKLVTAAEAVRRFPFAGLSQVSGSRELLDDHLEGIEAAQLEAFEQALALAVARASEAYDAQEGWLDGVRAGLLALLEFFDSEQALARYLLVHSAHAGPAVLERRADVLDALAEVLDDERAPARGYPPPLTAQALSSGVLGVLHERCSKRDPGTLAELCNSLMSFIVLPFLGARAARLELARSVEATLTPVEPGLALWALRDPGGRLNQRTVSVLTAIGSEPGLNSRELASRDGVKDHGQMSRLLSRLARLGLIENTREAQRRGDVKAWQLTIAPEELEAAIAYEPPTPPRSVALELMRASGGRLKDRAISVLRVIGSEPNLSNNQIALRVPITNENSMSQHLSRLARRGLLENTRTGGRENVWRLTPSGEHLERAIWHETPAPLQRSLALDMLRVRGGRLNHRVVSVLLLIAANPGLSNNDIALRVHIEGKGDASRLLARLARFGLIENTRTGGRENEWHLTTSGVELETAIRDDSRRVK
jgi:DNA-binding MarR family transcriptional regulator